MPILVKDVEWSETSDNVTLNVPLKGASNKNVDIFDTNHYIKVSYPPYFYEVALHDEVDDDVSKAIIENGVVSFLLTKKKASIWGQLQSSNSTDKDFLRELRLNAVTYKQLKEDERTKRKNAEHDKRKKLGVKEQMRLDNEEKEELEEKKKAEVKQACSEIDEWKSSSTYQQTRNHSNIEEISNKENSPPSIKLNGNSLIDKKKEKTKTTVKTSNKNAIVKDKKKEIFLKETTVEEVPPPRQTGQIQVKFTPRVLATPARESKLPEEEMWLQKVAQMNKIKKERCEDAIDIEEMNPMWLKDKGNEFYQQENYVAAINAYTSALLLDSKIPMIYANRAACHLHLKQYKECIQDCTSALEYYEPPVQANAQSRCRALARRGAAYYNVKCYVEALSDYNASLKIDPNNEALKVDAHKIRRIIQGGESSD